MRLFTLIPGVVVSILAQPALARDLSSIDVLSDSKMAAGRNRIEGRLRASRLTGHIEERLGVPTFVRARGLRGRLTPPVLGDPEQQARQALRDIADIYSASAVDVDALRPIDLQKMPSGAVLVRFENRVDGIEVFREQIGVLLDRDGALAAAGGYFIGGGAAQGAVFMLDEERALAAALRDFEFEPNTAATVVGTKGDYTLIAIATPSADGATLAAPSRAKRVWFRLPGGLEPAYYVEVQVADAADAPADYYAYIVSARSGKVLFRHRQTEDATYTVYADPVVPYRPANGPVVDYNPHPTGMPDGSRPAFAAPSVVTLNFGSISTQDPWLTAGAMESSGNNSDAYADLYAPDGYSNGDLRATTTNVNEFARTYDSSQSPIATPDQSMAAITQLFYVVNWLHDEYYDAGFNEVAFNGQNSNFGRGGLDGDAIKAEGQDNYFGGSRNNANMSTPADGLSPRMQMYAFSGRSTASLNVTPPGNSPTVQPADFGPTSFDTTSEVVVANDGSTSGTGGSLTDACQPLVDNVTGLIVLVDRGACTFKLKTLNAQNAGAVGVIVANNVAGELPGMGNDATIQEAITIGALHTALAEGNAIKTSLLSGSVNAQLFRSSEPERDGTMDSLIIAHEWGHFISNRLVGNAAGLTTSHARGLGEGWSDFHALLMTVESGDDFNSATYSGSTYAADGPFLDGAFYGLRRYPYTTDLAKNPLTFRHIEDGVALPASPPPAGGGPNSEVHNAGEVWASMLWECYENLLTDRGHPLDVAYDRMKRYIVGGYKLTPNAPTFVEARDGILAVAFETDPADYLACAQGFAKRGLGIGAFVPDRFDPNNAGIVESFTLDADVEVLSVTLDDTPGYCDADGMLDSGEIGTLKVVVSNIGSQVLAATSVTVTTVAPGVTFPDGQTAFLAATDPFKEATVTFRVGLAGIEVPTSVSFDITVADDPGALNETMLVSFPVHVDNIAEASSTDETESAIFAWSTRLVDTTDESFRWSRREYSTFEHTFFGPDSATIGATYLESPMLNIAADSSFSIMLSHRFAFEDYGLFRDGGVIEISADAGKTWTDIGSGPSGYTGTINASENPFMNRSAYTGSSPGYPSYLQQVIDLGSAYQGQTVRIRFGIGTALPARTAGWDIASIAFSGITNTPFPSLVTDSNHCEQTTLFTDGFE
jgi:hypothetical protein